LRRPLKNGAINENVDVGKKSTEEADSQARPDEHSYGDIFAPYVALHLESTQMTTLEANLVSEEHLEFFPNHGLPVTSFWR
jgi:hypothetical protein